MLNENVPSEVFKAHVKECEARFNKCDEQFSQILMAQSKNTESIQDLIDETRAVVELHRDVQGATRLGMAVQRFMVWLLKWGTIGTAIVVGIKWVTDNMS